MSLLDKDRFAGASRYRNGKLDVSHQGTDLLVEPSVAANRKVKEAAEPVQPPGPDSVDTLPDSQDWCPSERNRNWVQVHPLSQRNRRKFDISP